MVATSTLCLNVYSSLVFKELISMAMALFWVIACMRSSVIESAASTNLSDPVLLYTNWMPSETRFLTLSDNVTFEGSLVRSFSTFWAAAGERILSSGVSSPS